jgi:hypothetical protein
MSHFEDARTLVHHCENKIRFLRNLHGQCLQDQAIKPQFQLEVKSFVENLRSALDYCARGLFEKYAESKKANPKIYFPYAKRGDDRKRFRDDIVERCIPGLLASRPDIVDHLETYQFFGNSGNWLLILVDITNEHKHEQLTPQLAKEYKRVQITTTIPPAGTVTIDLKRIPLRAGSDEPVRAKAAGWSGFAFANTGVVVIFFLENTLQNVGRVVRELSGL